MRPRACRVLAWAWFLAVSPALAGGNGRLHAQEPPGPLEEGQLLRTAAALEGEGRAGEAAALLADLLQRKPTSSGGLFALERVLRGLGRVADVLPHADRYLEADPGAPGPHHLKLRVLVEVDSLQALDAAARAWFQAEAGSPDPYREVARLYRRAYGARGALEVLRQGRSALGGAALALETGDVLLALDRPRDAVAEWALALQDGHVDLEGLLDRVREPAVRDASLDPLVEILLRLPQERSGALDALRLTLAVGDTTGATQVASRGLDRMGPDESQPYLAAVADLAASAGVPALEAWALARESQVDAAPSPGREARLAAAALAAGDTAAALAAQTRLARALPPGSVERRRVVADLIRVEAHRADEATLQARLDGFRAEFPDAPETDELAALVASTLASRGQRGAALEVAGQPQGPRTQLERAWLLFGEGKADQGREALEAALPGLAPVRATEMIQLLATLDRVGPSAGSALAQAAAAVHRGKAGQARAVLDSALVRIPVEDRPPLLHRAAGLALDQGDTVAAASHLDRLVREHGESPEVPEALFWLARLRAAHPEGVDEARALLRRLILERPQAAVVPAARRELERLGRGG